MTLFFVSCEQENKYPSSGIKLTDVYSLTNIQNSDLDQINVYKEKDLVVNYITEVNVYSSMTTNYSDTSSDSDFVFEWTVTEERTVGDELETYSVLRQVTALKSNGSGSMVVTATYPDNSTNITTHTVVVTENEVYN